jgi:hypothetical protein
MVQRLARTHGDVDRRTSTRQKVPVYTSLYIPVHYRALCHLDAWGKHLVSQVTRLLKDSPWSQDEMEPFARFAE